VDEAFLNLRTLEQNETETPSVKVVLSWREWPRHSIRTLGMQTGNQGGSDETPIYDALFANSGILIVV